MSFPADAFDVIERPVQIPIAIFARRASNCPKCRHYIARGDAIFRIGSKWVCETCADEAREHVA